EFARSLDGGATWDPPSSLILQPLSSGYDVESGYIVVDEQGGVNVFWEDGLERGLGGGQHSYVLHRRSTDHGGTFSPVDTAAAIRQNWYAGPPGFNRRDGFFEFPNAACDRSAGANRGTLYLTWNEGAEPSFSGVPGAPQAEVEFNGSVASANAVNL